MSESFVCINKNGETIGPSIANMDARAFEFKEFWEKRLGKKSLFKITGQPLHVIFPINKLLWIKKYKQDIFKKTFKFLCYEDFLYYLLGGCCFTSESIAARTMLYDISKKTWSETVLWKPE